MDKTDCWVTSVNDDGSDGDTFWWPFCEVNGCANRVCTWLSHDKCYPHSANKYVIELKKNLTKVRELV